MKMWREKRKSRERPGLNPTKRDENIGANAIMRKLKRISCAILSLVLVAALCTKCTRATGILHL